MASDTGPAVSSGGGTQAFLFASQGKIAYADHLLESWKASGLYDDFLPGLLATMKTPKGYAAIPYNQDVRVLWYNTSLLDKAGAEVPTDWQLWLTAAAALKKIGVYGYGISTGAGSYVGGHSIVSLMINNGGGLSGVDPAVYEAARVDGATRLQTFIRITMPLIARPTYISWILMTIFCVNDFPTVYLLTGGGPVNSTTTLVVLAYRTVFENFQTGPGVAVAFFMTFTLVVISMTLYRRIRKAHVE